MNYAEILSNIIAYLLSLLVCLKTNCDNQYMNGTNSTTLPTTTTSQYNNVIVDKMYLEMLYQQYLSLTRQMDLSNRSITLVEPNTFNDNQLELKVRELFLQNNRLKRLYENTFSNLKSIEQIHLSDNMIELIDSRSFNNLPNLFWIDLSRNALQNLNQNQFINVTNLKVLLLNNNQIETISNQPFDYLVNLNRLDLSYNKIDQIYSTTFQLLTNLTQLYLNNNQIKSLDMNSFKNNFDLGILTLNNNRLSCIIANLFANMNKLYLLDLSFNQIGYIYSRAFYNLINLVRIDLNSNYISQLDANTFLSVPNLSVLTLSNNSLDSSLISIDSFRKELKKLIKLDLSHNVLNRLDKSIFDGLVNLKILNLSYNKLKFNQNETELFNICSNQSSQMIDIYITGNQFASINYLFNNSTNLFCNFKL